LRPIVIDTSLWIDWLHGKSRVARERSQGRIIYMPAIVAQELLSGAKDRRTDKAIHEVIGAFSRNGRFVVPVQDDYMRAGSVLADLGWPASKKSNDVLISVCSRRIGAEVWTKDTSDFSVLGKHLFIPILSEF
jgi:predicted nucleic acid-binding protein